ncbi:MAG: hypothetical protein JOZ14_09365 [Acidobacteria bacterium]|nr:hypothetical protein [Acidobacteriota bacterium]
MQKRLSGLFALFALLLALTPASPAAGERHPQIRAAMRALQNAKQHLEHAAHDFGGHRVEAMRAIDEAHHQLEVCLQYDKD